MHIKKEKAKQAEEIIKKFSKFIRFNIQKFNPQSSSIDVDDILQEVELKLWKVLQSEKKITNHSLFIRKVIHSSVIDIMRKLKREKEILDQYYNLIKEKNCSHDISLQEEMNQLIAQAVDLLKEPRRKVVSLYLLGMESDEISNFLKWSKDKVRNLLYRGLTDLKNILKEKGINYENN